MTEHTVPMGGTALAEPPAPVLPTGDDDTADAGNRRKLVMVGAALGAVLLLVAAFFLLKGGDSTPVSSGAPVLPHPAAAAPQAAPKAHAAKPLKLPKAYKGHVGKDPFKPLYVAPVQASEAPSTSPSTSGQDATGDASGVPLVPPTTSHPSTTTTLGHPVWVELVRVNGTHDATFVVGYSNGRRLTTKTFRGILAPKGDTGTTFGLTRAKFRLLSVQNGEATIQFGDGTPIDIAPGAANKVVVN